MNTSNVALVLISMLISYVYVFAFLFRTFKVDYYNPIVKTSVNWLEPIPNAIFFFSSNPLLNTILISLFAKVIGAFLVLSNSYSAVFIFIICVFDVVGFIVQVLFFSIIGSVIMSWVSPNSDNLFFRLVNEFSDAILNPIRKFIPAMGGLDLTPIFGLILFNFLSSFVGNGFIVWQLALR